MELNEFVCTGFFFFPPQSFFFFLSKVQTVKSAGLAGYVGCPPGRVALVNWRHSPSACLHWDGVTIPLSAPRSGRHSVLLRLWLGSRLRNRFRTGNEADGAQTNMMI